jgi:hypothetical protein
MNSQKGKIIQLPFHALERIPDTAYDQTDSMLAEMEFQKKQEELRAYLNDYKTPEQLQQNELAKIFPW